MYSFRKHLIQVIVNKKRFYFPEGSGTYFFSSPEARLQTLLKKKDLKDICAFPRDRITALHFIPNLKVLQAMRFSSRHTGSSEFTFLCSQMRKKELRKQRAAEINIPEDKQQKNNLNQPGPVQTPDWELNKLTCLTFISGLQSGHHMTLRNSSRDGDYCIISGS